MANQRITFHVNSNINEVMKDIGDARNLALAAMGDVVEGYAKEDCPVDTGLLHNSITHGRGGEAPKINRYQADRAKNGVMRTGSYPNQVPGDGDTEYVGTNVEYAPAVEFLERSHLVGKAHFLRDAAQNHIDELKDKAETVFRALG